MRSVNRPRVVCASVEKIEVDAKDVDGVIDNLRLRMAEKKPVDRAAKDKDEAAEKKADAGDKAEKSEKKAAPEKKAAAKDKDAE